MALISGLSPSSLALGLVLLLALKLARAYHERSKLKHIQTLGPDGFLTSYITAFRWITKATDIVEEGYRQFPNSIYKVPTINGWYVMVNGRDMIDDIRRAPDEQLSSLEAIKEILQTSYTIHPQLLVNPYHVNVIRSPLTRNIGSRFADLHDEVVEVITQKIPPSDDWIAIPTHATALQIVVRAVNRFLVGLPLCREPDWCDLNIEFTVSIVSNAMLINVFPKFMHPVVGRIFSGHRAAIRRAKKYLKPIIEERLSQMQEQFGKEWPDKPNDLIQWCLDAESNAPLSQRTSVEDLCVRVLTVNFGAIHTTSLAFTYALFYLAAHPELAEPLRKEVETVIELEGWSKVGMVQMKLLDSFLKESERLNLTGAVGLSRKVMKQFTFSNGITVPVGTMLNVATWALHRDDEIYPDSFDFKPWRFSDMRRQEGEGIKHQLVTPTLEWQLFGQGKHACPGRFFAAAELKALIAHVLLNYDVKFANDSRELPPLFKFMENVSANQTAEVLFRKRRLD